MVIYNRYGSFAFSFETAIEQLAYMHIYNPPLVLAPYSSFYVFKRFCSLQDYSIKGDVYADGTVATMTYAGDFGDIFRANDFTYSFRAAKIVKVATITQKMQVDCQFSRDGLIQDGVITQYGRLRGYDCYYDLDTNEYFYTNLRFGAA